MSGRLMKLWGCVGLLVAASACSRQKEEPPPGAAAPEKAAPTRVKLALNWVPEPEFGGFYAARESGAFTRHGLDVIPLFAVYQTSPHAIMAHASRGAKGIKDVLSSGTVALEPGLSYVAFLKKKYSFDKVKVVPYDGGVARFLADKDFAQQCFVTAEPIAAKRQGATPAVFLVADEGFNPYIAVVITRKQYWKEQPERVKAFVAAVREGWRAYLDNPGPTNAVMGKLNTTMDAETFAAAAEAQKPLIETEETRARGLGMMKRERWEQLSQQLVELGLIEKVPAVDEYLLPEFTAARE